LLVSGCLFFLWIPEEKRYCLAMEKEGVRAVIDILTAEVPQVEAH
jgi:hypothetical protein